MSSSPEMRVLHLRIHKDLLYCTYCRRPLRPDKCLRKPFMCAGGHIFCRECTSCHENACISCCLLMDGIMAQMKFKCNFCHSGSGNIPYSSFIGHLCDHPLDPKLVGRQIESVFYSGECTLNADLLGCSECKLPLRPPIFKHLSRDSPVCSACYCGDIDNYLHCRELDYLVQGITVKCVACEEYLPFSTLALHQLDDCPFKHKLQKTAPGSSAQKNFCDEYGSTRSSAGNSTNIGKSKGKAPPRVRKMGNHIVDSNVDESDDDSSDDIHSETGKRVAETALDTSAYNKKAKTAMPSGQKTDEYGSTRSSAGNSTNIGKSKGKAPPRVRKMDNHESDDDSSDDIHPETGKRVAETVLKTSAYNKKAKIATPSGGHKTGEKMGAHPANN